MNLSLVPLLTLLSALPAFGTYVAPVGIPNPPFGIDESHAAYAGQTFQGGGFLYQDAGNGPYTHYVDNSRSCSDANNNGFGSAVAPRCTIPASFPVGQEGAVVEVHGGPYSNTNAVSWNFNGTAAKPIFIRGVGNPVIAGGGDVVFTGAYGIIENLIFGGKSVGMSNAHHLSLRQSMVTGFMPASNGAAVWTNPTADHIVIYKNEIHHNGDSLSATERDVHGIKPVTGTSYIWILDNHIHHNGGDSVQVGEANSLEPWAHHIYIGRNQCHEDRENAIDIKKSRSVFISQNLAYGYTVPVDASSAGEAIVIHDNPETVWVTNNFVTASQNGIVDTGSVGTFLIGNLVTNINGPNHPNATTVFGPRGIYTGSAGALIANNTVWNAEGGISLNTSAGGALVNNIIGGSANSAGYTPGALAFGSDATVTLSTMAKNYIVGSGGLVNKGGVIFNTLSDFWAVFPTRCRDCDSLDPEFANVSTSDFQLLSGSPAIDQGVNMTPITDAYQSAYGAALNRDMTCTTRPQGSAWDIGAYEAGQVGQCVDQTGGSGGRCDVNGNGSTDITDVQQSVNQAIGVTGCTVGDINSDGVCNVIDVQRVVNAALGGSCISN